MEVMEVVYAALIILGIVIGLAWLVLPFLILQKFNELIVAVKQNELTQRQIDVDRNLREYPAPAPVAVPKPPVPAATVLLPGLASVPDNWIPKHR